MLGVTETPRPTYTVHKNRKKTILAGEGYNWQRINSNMPHSI